MVLDFVKGNRNLKLLTGGCKRKGVFQGEPTMKNTMRITHMGASHMTGPQIMDLSGNRVTQILTQIQDSNLDFC